MIGPNYSTPVQNAINAVLPPGGVKTPTPFSQLMDRNKFLNQPMLEKFGFSRVDPEINRIRTQGLGNLYGGAAQQGSMRFGGFQTDMQRYLDSIERQRKEMAMPFVQQGAQKLSDYYADLEKQYYMDPNAFQMKPIDYSQILGIPNEQLGLFQGTSGRTSPFARLVQGNIERTPQSINRPLSGTSMANQYYKAM